MGRRKKKTFEDTSMKEISIEEVSSEIQDFVEATDPNQIDLEDQIAEEEQIVEEKEYKLELTRFKNPAMQIQIPGVHQVITNDNITKGDIDYLINNNICSESDFC